MKKAIAIFLVILLCGGLILSVYFYGQNEIQKVSAELEKKTQEYESLIKEIVDENKYLDARVGELEEKLLDARSTSGKEVTNSQIMNDLKEIFRLYKAGKKTEAKAQFVKIPEMGFDDTTYDYYQVLKELFKTVNYVQLGETKND